MNRNKSFTECSTSPGTGKEKPQTVGPGGSTSERKSECCDTHSRLPLGANLGPRQTLQHSEPSELRSFQNAAGSDDGLLGFTKQSLLLSNFCSSKNLAGGRCCLAASCFCLEGNAFLVCILLLQAPSVRRQLLPRQGPKQEAPTAARCQTKDQRSRRPRRNICLGHHCSWPPPCQAPQPGASARRGPWTLKERTPNMERPPIAPWDACALFITSLTP